MVFIFDMDGVIVDNHEWHFKAWVEFGKRHGLTITQEEFGRYFGSTNQLVLNSLFGNDITTEDILRMGNEKEAIYRELYGPYIKVVEGLPEFLHDASERGIPIALATSAPFENVQFTLEATGLVKYFSIITDASMVTRGKPDPQVYSITAVKLGVQPSECIVFEDSVPGILSAKNAGMRVIGIATTHTSDELSPHVAEIIVNFDPEQKFIRQILNQINPNQAIQ